MVKSFTLLAVAASALVAISPANATLVVTGNFANAALSIDGFADNGSGNNTIRADVPFGSTVLQAYLYSADVFGNNPTLGTLDFAGTTYTFGAGTYLAPDANPANTVRFDVTSSIAPTINGGPGGIYNFNIAEHASLDGEVLVVVYRNASTLGNAIILDGELALGGDVTTLGFTSAYAGGAVIVSVADSFSFNGGGTTDVSGQVTLIDVSTNVSPALRRLTSCAGGNDDAGFLGANGSLLTVGGIGDSTANPDPNCAGGAGDDELYDLSQGNSANAAPFIALGTNTVTFTTSNPSFNDNVFGLFITTPQQTVVNPTPEPGMIALFGLSIAGLGLVRRRRA